MLSVIWSTSSVFKCNKLKSDLFQLLIVCSKHREANGDCHSCITTCPMHFGIKGELKRQGKGPLLYGFKYFWHLDIYTRDTLTCCLSNVIVFICLYINGSVNSPAGAALLTFIAAACCNLAALLILVCLDSLTSSFIVRGAPCPLGTVCKGGGSWDLAVLVNHLFE